MDEKVLSVIIPIRNEAHNIPAFLASLPSGVQLIVVDASQDAAPELVQTLRPHNTLLLRYASTVTQARQWGVEAAETS